MTPMETPLNYGSRLLMLHLATQVSNQTLQTDNVELSLVAQEEL